MSTAYITIGIPAAGKSTYAREFAAADLSITVEKRGDAVYYDRPWRGPNV